MLPGPPRPGPADHPVKRESFIRRAHTFPLLVLLTLALTGCGRAVDKDGSPSSPRLLVLAAASLTEAMPALIAAFEAETGTPSDLVLSATGNLAAQIQNGAPADLFFSADVETVDRLVDSGTIDPTSVRTFAVGGIVLVWRTGAPPPGGLEEIVNERFEVIAIANPEIAPYGAAARAALQAIGVWNTIQPRIVQGENISQTYQFVRTGNADVAIVARSIADPEFGSWLPIDQALHEPVRQAAGVLERSTHPAAHDFLDFVVGPEGQAILQDHGFGAADQ